MTRYEFRLLFWNIFVWLLNFYLSFASGNQMQPMDVLINLIMLGLSTWIINWTIKKWIVLNKVTKDLTNASSKIYEDSEYNNGHKLWGLYPRYDSLFKTKELQKPYDLYISEAERQKQEPVSGITCNIEDYINNDLINSLVSRNRMNQMPGVLTGLGILGTFIGLSLGLQNFTTGTSDEILQSIPPLMDGIKVAFYTSVYGMILSLVYNLTFKHKMELAENTLNQFLSIYEEKVLPDPVNDVLNKFLQYQQEQSEQLKIFAGNLGKQIAKGIGQQLSESLAPQFEHFDQTVKDFTNIAAQNQLEGIQRVVDKFVDEMNESLGDRFKDLGGVLDRTYKLQNANADQMQEILTKTGSMTGSISQIDTASQQIITALEGYITKVEALQSVINQNFESVGQRLQNTQTILVQQKQYIEDLTKVQKSVADAQITYSSAMKEQTGLLQKTEADIRNSAAAVSTDMQGAAKELHAASTEMSSQINESVKASFEQLKKELDQLRSETDKVLSDSFRQQIQELTKASAAISANMQNSADTLAKAAEGMNPKILDSFSRTFELFDRNLAEIEKHLSGTISQMHSETARVPEVVSDAYAGIKASLDETRNGIRASLDQTASEINNMVRTLEHDRQIMTKAYLASMEAVNSAAARLEASSITTAETADPAAQDSDHAEA